MTGGGLIFCEGWLDARGRCVTLMTPPTLSSLLCCRYPFNDSSSATTVTVSEGSLDGRLLCVSGQDRSSSRPGLHPATP